MSPALQKAAKVLFVLRMATIVVLLATVALFLLAWHVVNDFYHPDTYDQVRFWVMGAAALLAALGLVALCYRWRRSSVLLSSAVIGTGLFAVSNLLVNLGLL